MAGNCILAWAIQKEPVWCPQCKAPFATVLTYRKLDGSLSDFPVEESVCLLKRAHWFESHMKVRSNLAAHADWNKIQHGSSMSRVDRVQLRNDLLSAAVKEQIYCSKFDTYAVTKSPCCGICIYLPDGCGDKSQACCAAIADVCFWWRRNLRRARQQ